VGSNPAVPTQENGHLTELEMAIFILYSRKSSNGSPIEARADPHGRIASRRQELTTAIHQHRPDQAAQPAQYLGRAIVPPEDSLDPAKGSEG